METPQTTPVVESVPVDPVPVPEPEPEPTPAPAPTQASEDMVISKVDEQPTDETTSVPQDKEPEVFPPAAKKAKREKVSVGQSDFEKGKMTRYAIEYYIKNASERGVVGSKFFTSRKAFTLVKSRGSFDLGAARFTDCELLVPFGDHKVGTKVPSILVRCDINRIILSFGMNNPYEVYSYTDHSTQPSPVTSLIDDLSLLTQHASM